MAEAKLGVPKVLDNPDGWGPPDGALVLENLLQNVPYAPFSKADKLGRAADWTRSAYAAVRPGKGGQGQEFTVFDYAFNEAEEETFRLVDGKPPPKPKFGPRWRFQQQRPQLPQRKDEEVEARRREQEKERLRRDRFYSANRANAGGPGGAYHQRREAAVLKSSVDIQPEWTLVEQIPFSTFSKLSFSVADPPEDVLLCGALEFYDKSFDRLTPKSERRLERVKNRNFFKVTTTDDPVIRRLANSDDDDKKANVFATDAILATLMCAPRSVYSWDIVVQKVGNKLFFDKRDGSQLDLLSVNETSQEPLPEAKEDINSAYSLSVEAAYINQNFSQQILIRDGHKEVFDEPNPFASEGEEVASVAYRYRRWKLDEDVYLVARCELHAVLDAKGHKQYMTVNALNEFDPKYSGVDWRQKLETQRGAVLATELKNNANKLAKWTAQALLASADVMKLGYVSRIHPRDHLNHAVLAVQGYKPKEFAMQINLSPSNMWGIVKSIIDICLKLNDGKYVLVKDPSKPQLRIYEVPNDAFENDYVEEPLPEEEQVPPPAEEEIVAPKPDEEKDVDVDV